MDENWSVPVAVWQDGISLQGSTNFGTNPPSGMVNVDGSVLQNNLNAIMSKLDVLISEASLKLERFSVTEVKVSLAVDASGSVSILGFGKASAGGKTALEVKLVPRG